MIIKNKTDRCRRRESVKRRHDRLPKRREASLQHQMKSAAAGPASKQAKILTMPGSPLVRFPRISRISIEGSHSSPARSNPTVIPSVQSPEGATQDKTQSPKPAKKARPQKRKATKGRISRQRTLRRGSKKARIIALLRRPGGASLNELQTATHWKPHSLRGFISAQLKSKMKLAVRLTKRADGSHAYLLGSK